MFYVLPLMPAVVCRRFLIVTISRPFYSFDCFPIVASAKPWPQIVMFATTQMKHSSGQRSKNKYLKDVRQMPSGIWICQKRSKNEAFRAPVSTEADDPSRSHPEMSEKSLNVWMLTLTQGPFPWVLRLALFFSYLELQPECKVRCLVMDMRLWR